MEKLEINHQKEQTEKEKREKLLSGCQGSLEEALEILEEKKEFKEKKKAIQDLLEIVLESKVADDLPLGFLEKLKYTILATVEMIF